MINEILPNLYQVEIPLPNNPLKALNSYIIKGKSRNLIIDTGFNRVECKNKMLSDIEQLGIDLEKTDLFITHMHADHSGLISALATDSSKVYCSKIDGEAINAGKAMDFWIPMQEYAKLSGFPNNELVNAIEKHPGYKFSTDTIHEFTEVQDGDTITLDDFQLTCIFTPGHTQGHVCLYDSQKKILFSGDHILARITPNISLWSDNINPLGQYLASLDKISKMEIDLVLPAHRGIVTNSQARIRELKEHHEHRLEQIVNILKEGQQSGYEVAAKMKWDMTYKSFNDFPTPQKWFAIGEALAHLKYLEEMKLVEKRMIKGKYLYYSK